MCNTRRSATVCHLTLATLSWMVFDGTLNQTGDKLTPTGDTRAAPAYRTNSIQWLQCRAENRSRVLHGHPLRILGDRGVPRARLRDGLDVLAPDSAFGEVRGQSDPRAQLVDCSGRIAVTAPEQRCQPRDHLGYCVLIE